MALDNSNIPSSGAFDNNANNSNALKKIGTKHEVYLGQACKTSGGLCKDDLMESKRGHIVSKKRHEQGKKAFKNIQNYCQSKPENKEDCKEEDLPAEENNDINDDLKTQPMEEPVLENLKEEKNEEQNIQDIKEEEKATKAGKKAASLGIKLRKSRSKNAAL